MKRLNQKGYNLVELAIAVLILGVMASAVLMARSYMAKTTEKTSAKAYATQKAIQMFEELKSVAATGAIGVNTLDNYSDGSLYNQMLTTDQAITLATDPISGNFARGSGWKYWRQINIIHVAQDPFARIAEVRVFGANSITGQPADLLAQVGGLLRTNVKQKAPTQVYDVYALCLSNVLGWFTTVPQMKGTFDKALTRLENLNPGLEFRRHYIVQTGFGRDPYYNPNINVAQSTTSASALPFVYLYPGLTPQDATGSGNQLFFNNTDLAQVGQILQDGTLATGSVTWSICDMYNADKRYPEDVRDYAAVTQAAVASGNDPPELPLRMLLEQMISNSAGATNGFKNALMLSMHGEVLPLPNMRNYSDPAKDPANFLNARVVTHPECIHYKTGQAVNLRVYGYYDGLENPSTLDTGSYNPNNSELQADNITIYIPGVTLISANIAVTAIYGGNNNGTLQQYQKTLLSQNSVAGPDPFQMRWSFTAGNSGTTITLKNTPLRCPQVVQGGFTTGLSQSNRLYGAEYIPCPVDTSLDFVPDLTSTTPGPMNTARWIINISNLPDGQYDVETRIGTDLTTGTSAGVTTELCNLSRTFVWVGTGNNLLSNGGWGGYGAVPFTEQFQYNGDPRDCPYLDVKFGSSAVTQNDSGTNIPADSYNWYFKNFNTADGYSGFGKATGGYADIQDCRDIPRYYYTYRKAMLNNSVVYANMNGYSFWHASEGGEIGGTYNPYSSSLSFDRKPWDPTTTGTVSTIDEIQTSNNWDGPDAVSGNSARVVAKYNGAAHDPRTLWYARSWIGEMYPDDWFTNGGGVTSWLNNGNLPTGTTGFWRVPMDAVTLSAGTTDGFESTRNPGYQWGVGARGPDAFMNGATGLSGAATNYGFIHTTNYGSGPQADVQQLGLNIYPITNFPLDSPISCTRPWAYNGDLSGQGVLPVEWNDSFYKPLRTILSLPSYGGVNRILYQSELTTGSQSGPVGGDTWHGLGTIQMSTVPAAGTTTAFCYYIPSGIAPQGNFDNQALVQLSVGAMMRAFLDGGVLYGATASAVTMGHIAQLPLFQISCGTPANQFTNPSAVTLTWASPVSLCNMWLRWAGLTNGGNYYTEEYPGYSTAPAGAVTNSTYSEPTTLNYVPMWAVGGHSNDDASKVTWYYINTASTVAPPGLYYANTPAASYATTLTSVVWNTPVATFPQGTYTVRVEAYRPGQPLHYSYHAIDINFTR